MCCDLVNDRGIFGFDVCEDVFEALYSYVVIKPDIDRTTFAKEFDEMSLDEKKDTHRFFNRYMLFRPTYSVRGIVVDLAVRDELIARGVTSDEANKKVYRFFDSMDDLIGVEDVDTEMVLSCVKLAVNVLA